MASTNQEPAPPTAARAYNARLGLILFAVYSILYCGFVFINAFNASLMEKIVVAGLNLAIVYGFGLILAALLMALFYGTLCKNEPIDVADASDGNSTNAKGDHA